MKQAVRLQLILSIILIVIGFSSGRAQSMGDLKMQLPSISERYEMDYEIVGVTNPTPEFLATFDLDQYEELRLPHDDVEVTDETTGYHIILYSVDRAIANYTHKKDPDSISD